MRIINDILECNLNKLGQYLLRKFEKKFRV